MIIQIQSNFECENCIKCGQRPQIEQTKKHWAVACPDANCKNVVKDTFVNFATWNRLNKKAANITKEHQLKQIA